MNYNRFNKYRSRISLKRTRIILSLMFGLFLLIFAVIDGSFIYENNFMETKCYETKATIVHVYNNGEDDDSVYIKYNVTVDGITYQNNSADGDYVNYEGSNPKINDEIQIFIDLNSGKVYCKHKTSIIIMSIFTVVFLGLFLGFTISYILKNKRIKYLKTNGRKKYMPFLGFEVNTHVRINGYCPERIVCGIKNPITDEEKIYKGENIFVDDYDKYQNKMIAVYLDPNSNRYYIDENDYKENVL